MLYFLMFLQIGAMFYAMRLHQRRQLFANVIPAGIAVQIFGMGTVFVAVLKIIFLVWVGGTQNESRQEVANAESAALWYVGSYLSEYYPGKKLTVLIAPWKHADPNQKNRLNGFMEGLQKKLTSNIVEVKFNNSKGKRRRRSYTHENLDLALKKHQDQDIVMSLIGLPRRYYEMPFWQQEKLPMIFAYRGFSWEIDIDIRESRISGFITFNPRHKFRGLNGEKAEKSKEFFNKYFIFVTNKNIERMVKKYPSLFYKPAEKG